MKSKLGLSGLTGALVVGFAISIAFAYGKTSRASLPAPTCPEKANGESAEDCPWADLTREFEALGTDQSSVIHLLAEEQPVLYTQMNADAKLTDWLGLWGLCINYDEFAKGDIVPTSIFYPLNKLFSPPTGSIFQSNDHEIRHAGIQHTYGYLFSNLKTAFGYKRARWVRPTLDRGFGLPPGTLSPVAKSGSLFSNVTYFAGRIAFRGEPQKLAVLEKHTDVVSPAIRDFDYDSLKITRLEETIETHLGKIVLRTDFVAFVNPVEGDSNFYWLIYSVNDGQTLSKVKGSRLITAFPVGSAFVTAAFAAEGLGEQKPIITRYNAFVSGISGKSWTGSRRKL